MFADVGRNGRAGDAQVWNSSKLKEKLDNATEAFQAEKRIPGTNIDTPFIITADDAFQMTGHIMKPFKGSPLSHPEVIFNYRLSRHRRVVENAFGILAQRWRVYMGASLLSPDVMKDVVLATLCLHNMLSSTSRATYIPPGECDAMANNGDVIEGAWRLRDGNNRFVALTPARDGAMKRKAKEMRNTLKDFFWSKEGAVPWQWSACRIQQPPHIA